MYKTTKKVEESQTYSITRTRVLQKTSEGGTYPLDESVEVPTGSFDRIRRNLTIEV